jgi:hypothetical protein
VAAQVAASQEGLSSMSDDDDDDFIFSLWLYSPIQALAASMKLSVSLQLLHLGRVISSSQGPLSVHKHGKTYIQHKH